MKTNKTSAIVIAIIINLIASVINFIFDTYWSFSISVILSSFLIYYSAKGNISILNKIDNLDERLTTSGDDVE
jgi:hypothetical protein